MALPFLVLRDGKDEESILWVSLEPVARNVSFRRTVVPIGIVWHWFSRERLPVCGMSVALVFHPDSSPGSGTWFFDPLTTVSVR